jgi:hypothetical protein
MLAYYTTLVKKESLLDRIKLDADELAVVANDLVCEIKIASNSCKDRNVENLLSSISQAEDLIKVVNAMLDNMKNNTHAYVAALNPRQEAKKQEQQDKEEPSEVKSDKLTSLVDAIKSLKEMQSSIGSNESPKV